MKGTMQGARSPGLLFDGRPEGCDIVVGNACDVLKKLEANSFPCCVTSPPYWGLRDYRVPHQIGAEANLDDYLKKLTDIFSEVRRVLTEDGTLWLNIGDCYTSGDRKRRDSDKKNPAREMHYRPATPKGLKPKDLIGIPWRLAFALQNEGWYLRSDVIWHKPNCQPESVKDRPTRAHEYLFLFSKSKKYYYDHVALREEANGNGALRNRRTVWSINTEPYPGAHFATFPPRLVEPCILASTKVSDRVLDPFFGAGTVGQVCIGHHRRFLGIELKEDYAALARERLGWNGELDGGR